MRKLKHGSLGGEADGWVWYTPIVPRMLIDEIGLLESHA
jgi:hypothetical protein